MILQRKNVDDALKKLSGVITSKDNTSFMSGIKFNPGKIMGTNLAQTLFVDLPGSDLDVFVNFKALQSLIKKTRDENVEFMQNGQELSVETLDYSAVFESLLDEMMPDLQVDESLFKPVPSELLEGFAFCADFVSTETNRYVLCGVHVRDNVVEATDSHRLGRVVMKDGGFPDVIIPIDAINLFLNLGPLDYYFDGGTLWFRGEGFMFSTIVIDGRYPDTSKVFINKEESVLNMLLTEDLFDGSDIVNVFDNSDANGVKHRVTFSFAPGLLLIKSRNAQGSISFKREVDYEGQSVSFDVNMQYLQEAMKGESEFYLFMEGGPRLMLVSGSFTSIVLGVV